MQLDIFGCVQHLRGDRVYRNHIVQKHFKMSKKHKSYNICDMSVIFQKNSTLLTLGGGGGGGREGRG
jgi:hypothetical protein